MVRRVRSLVFWIHLSAGVLVGAVIFVMSATGAILALKPQIVRAIDRRVTVVKPESVARLPPSAVIASARAARGDALLTVMTRDRDPTAAVAVGMARAGTLYVNPYTGAVVGTASARAEVFFRTIEDWHRWLAVRGDRRSTARSLTGAANLAFLGLALSGLYLWWPRKWTPRHTRAILFFRRRRTGRGRDFNWHNVIGFWCAPAIIVMTASGVVMSYPWASDLLYRSLGGTPPSRAGERGSPQDFPASTVAPDQLDTMWARAERQLPTWATITARFPVRAGAPMAFSISDGGSWNRFARSQLTFDAGTGAVLRWQPYSESGLGQKARGWLRFAHTGELGGLPGQIIAGVGCLGGVVLVWTGLALALRRFVSRKFWARRRRRPALECADFTGGQPT